jgi:hypothetical protein
MNTRALRTGATVIAVAGVVVLTAGGEHPRAAAGARPRTEIAQLQKKLMTHDAGEHDCFGRSIAMNGDTIVAGAKGDDDVASNSGAVYVFQRSGDQWLEQAKLKASDPDIDDFFGFSVGISGDIAVVGAWQDDGRADGAGAAYVFRRTGTRWAQEAKLLARDGTPFDQFGYAVAINGDTILVGARQDDDRASGAGSAYVFRQRDGDWVQEAKLLAPDAHPSDQFGWSVAIRNATIAVGALSDDEAAKDAGAVYVYQRAGADWTLDAKLMARGAKPSDAFGYAVGVADGRVIAGAYRNDAGARDAGAAYVYERGARGWKQVARLVPSDPIATQMFGWSVSIDGDTAVVGAWYDTNHSDPEGPFGSAYVFTRTAETWTQHRKLVAAKPGPLDLFGWAVTVSGRTVAIGARLDDEAAAEAGAVYLYDLEQ